MLSIYRLPNQLPGEQVVKIIRRHFFILFRKIVLFLLLVFFFVAFCLVILYTYPDVTEQTYFPILVLAASSYLLFVWLFFFFSFIDYYLDVWIITNERIINIEQQGLFSRIISEQRLFRIQDVTSEVTGVLPTVFRFGNVYVQTAAEKERFSFEQIPDPNGVRDTLIKLAEIDRNRMSKEITPVENTAKIDGV